MWMDETYKWQLSFRQPSYKPSRRLIRDFHTHTHTAKLLNLNCIWRLDRVTSISRFTARYGSQFCASVNSCVCTWCPSCRSLPQRRGTPRDPLLLSPARNRNLLLDGAGVEEEERKRERMTIAMINGEIFVAITIVEIVVPRSGVRGWKSQLQK